MLGIYYAVLTLLIIIFELSRKKRFKIDFLTFFNFNFILYYTLPSFLLSIDFNNAAIIETKRAISDFQDLNTALSILIGYVLVNIGYLSKSARGLSNGIIIKRRISIKNDMNLYIGLVVLSVVSIFIYSLHYGGILRAISLSSVIRSGLVEAGSFSFFKRFFSASKFASFFLFSYILYENKKNKMTKTGFIFFISILVTIFGFLFLASRGVYIEYLLIFTLIFIIRYRKINLKKVGSIAVVGLFVLLYGDAIFSNLKYLPDGPMELLYNIQNSIKYNDINMKNTIYGILGNFQLSALSLNVAFDVINDYNFSYRFFSDVIYGFLSLIPEVLTGISVPETIAYHNTYYIKGEFISNIPPGMLGFAIYSMGWAGLFLFSYIWGWIGSFINRLLSNNMDNHYWMYPLYVLTAMDWSIASSGEPRLFFQSKFILLVIAYYLLFVSNKCFKKKTNVRRIED